jgi:hypothetical protein
MFLAQKSQKTYQKSDQKCDQKNLFLLKIFLLSFHKLLWIFHFSKNAIFFEHAIKQVNLLLNSILKQIDLFNGMPNRNSIMKKRVSVFPSWPIGDDLVHYISSPE